MRIALANDKVQSSTSVMCCDYMTIQTSHGWRGLYLPCGGTEAGAVLRISTR